MGLRRGLDLPWLAVDNRSPILCFGIRMGGKRSSYWRVRAGVKEPELFVERENFGKQWHLALHASGQWHMKDRRRELLSWGRPDEVVPGYTRALGIVLPVAVVHREDAAPDGVELITVPPDAESTIFSLFIERPGANMNGWPGKKAMGTGLVGRLLLAAGAGTCCVVAHQEPFDIEKVMMPRPSDGDLARMQQLAGSGALFLTTIGALSDGSIALVDLRSGGIELSLRDAAG